MKPSLGVVVLGPPIAPSTDDGHAATYPGLVRELVRRGHDVLFVAREAPRFRSQRHLVQPPWGRSELYGGLDELHARFAARVRDADLVIVGSEVAEGARVGDWVLALARGVRAFHDVDTPLTLARLDRGGGEHLRVHQVPRYDLYLSSSTGPTLARLEAQHGARRAVPLLCAVDPEQHHPVDREPRYDLGYLGPCGGDRRPALERLLLGSARRLPQKRFVVVGPRDSDDGAWPRNVRRVDHVAPPEQAAFYGSLRYALTLVRPDAVARGSSPSVRLFEAAACGTPVISDDWPGLETLLAPGSQVLLAGEPDDVVRHLTELSEDERREIARRARARVLAEHTAAHRAAQLEAYVEEALEARGRGAGVG